MDNTRHHAHEKGINYMWKHYGAEDIIYPITMPVKFHGKKPQKRAALTHPCKVARRHHQARHDTHRQLA